MSTTWLHYTDETIKLSSSLHLPMQCICPFHIFSTLLGNSSKQIFICREIYDRFRASYQEKEDVHTRLMRKYKDIPSWWFYVLLAVTTAVSLILCIALNKQVQMPWWGLLFASGIAFVFTLPISIITATTNQVFSGKVYGTATPFIVVYQYY